MILYTLVAIASFAFFFYVGNEIDKDDEIPVNWVSNIVTGLVLGIVWPIALIAIVIGYFFTRYKEGE